MVSESRGSSLKQHDLQRANSPVDSFSWTVLEAVIDRVEIVVRLFHSRNRDRCVAGNDLSKRAHLSAGTTTKSQGRVPLQFRSGVLSLSAPELAR